MDCEAESWLASEFIWYINGVLAEDFIPTEPISEQRLNEIREKIRIGSNPDVNSEDGGIKPDALNRDDCLVLKKVLEAVYKSGEIDLTAFLMPFDYIINEKLGEEYNFIDEYQW